MKTDYAVVFTQYLRPNGRRRTIVIDRDERIETLAHAVMQAGYHFDIEELTTGHVSMTVEKNNPQTDSEEQPIAHQLCMNGPDVPRTVDALIEQAAKVLFSER